MTPAWTDMHDVWRRFQYAERHLSRLAIDAEAWETTHATQVEETFDPESRLYQVRLAGKLPPKQKGLLLGDVLHGFRSTMDNLVYQLHNRSGATASEQAAFRVCTSFEGRQAKTHRQECEGLRKADRDVIEQFQPREWGEAATQHPLYLLNKFSNADKHRVLIPAVASHRYVVSSPLGLQRPHTVPRYLQAGDSLNVPGLRVLSGGTVGDLGIRSDADPLVLFWAELEDAGTEPVVELFGLDPQVVWHEKGTWLSMDHLRWISQTVRDLVSATETTL